jgi:uncharacterized protein YbjT (DUF2867 family)
MKIIVFGGNGYLGQRIVKSALKWGINVVSINRSGEPSNFDAHSYKARVEWLKGDIFQPKQWDSYLSDCSGVISCVGAFGSNEVIFF